MSDFRIVGALAAVLLQKQQWESTRLKRPTNAYIQFVQDFVVKYAAAYGSITNAVSAGQ